MKSLVVTMAVFVCAVSARAQLAGTQWKSKINTGQMLNVVLDFGKDTCTLYNMADSSTIEQMHYAIKDTLLTLQKIDGQSDCDNNTLGKYKCIKRDGAMMIILVADDCEDRSSTIDNSRWLPWVVPTEVKTDEAVLEQYVGTYGLDEQHPLSITLEGGRLYIEGPSNNLPKSPMIAESNSRFFLRIAGVEMDFVKDGSSFKLVSHEEKDYELKRLK